ncbi:ribonuclease H-like protein [Aspergillus eucalypticola CBS 122712]|uniref:Ribonuclease H-like protein n=1 Tax=Aspergillus eucalypticola (strain CBS 122712 / IBT 29274) TaxID=1448314 RepID=A0A317UQ59_ASPEC|nr:ribonuclease H-like protein [Aspergillus eucalypticola CBS 122712]PWY63386.1 ribonuclease H-like protein [Aspergillus eucalypticola CBS 122712]
MKYPWLRPLKAKALQQIAQKTGIQSSGTKTELVERLEGELAPLIIPLHTQIDAENDGVPKKHTKKRNDNDNGIRLLSIDMGIRNLAFAVLHAPLLSSHSSSTVSSETGTPKDTTRKEDNTITLTAWKRLSIPDLCHAQHHQHLGQDGFSSLITTTTKSKSISKSKSKETKAKAKEDFSPSLYARHAYTLITTLLTTYNPTHILIERQRFRTGGGSAVQEWTIRVGVLEGMLYAVLETVNSSGLFPSAGKVQVYPVEPGRVSRFWGEGEEAGDIGDGDVVKKTKKRKNVRDVKKMKIGLVRGWLSSPGSDSATAVGNGDGDEGRRVMIGDDEVRKLAKTFLEKCEGKRRIKKADGEDGENGEDSMDIGKLDDLADCLVQGVTWLEWQRMREKIVRDGGEPMYPLRRLRHLLGQLA